MATTSVGMTATFTATITILQVVGPPIFVPTSAIVSINEGLVREIKFWGFNDVIY